MPFDPLTGMIHWRVHLASPPEAVYRILATDEGRARFWAESAAERDGVIHFRFPNGYEWDGQILEHDPPRRFVVNYFSDRVSFELADDGAGGTDLLLTDEGDPGDERHEVLAGWVSVLLALKASVDFSVDLRNHDPDRSWDQGYADN